MTKAMLVGRWTDSSESEFQKIDIAYGNDILRYYTDNENFDLLARRETFQKKDYGQVKMLNLPLEKHGIENITLEETFQDVQFPDPPVPERGMQDLRPRQGARIIDAALRIPNINDDYEGAAPDCGAYEYGQELPHYGPRR